MWLLYLSVRIYFYAYFIEASGRHNRVGTGDIFVLYVSDDTGDTPICMAVLRLDASRIFCLCFIDLRDWRHITAAPMPELLVGEEQIKCLVFVLPWHWRIICSKIY